MEREPDWRPAEPLRDWTREMPERRVAGVCAGVARQLQIPLTVVRAAFIVATLMPGLHLLGPAAYAALWLVMPAAPGEPSGLDRVTDVLHSIVDSRDDDADVLEDERLR